MNKEQEKEFDEKFGYKKPFGLRISDLKAHISKLLEEERKKAREEERNEIIKFCEEHRTVRKVNGVRYINIEQLKAKYIKE